MYFYGCILRLHPKNLYMSKMRSIQLLLPTKGFFIARWCMHNLLVKKIFKSLFSQIIEVYVDDMITKYTDSEEHVKHLGETFEPLKKYKIIKLNLEKCVFEVSSNKFLGFTVSYRWIKANLEKIGLL